MARPKSEVKKDYSIKIRMTEDEYNRLKAYAIQNDESMSQVVNRSLEATYNASKNKK